MISEQNPEIYPCSSCGSRNFISPIVVGRGNIASRVMLIGEAPGAMEEKKLKPFVGRSGKLLNYFLENAGFDVDKDIYISNLVKTRPPNNRKPSAKEISLHLPWLYQQIKIVKPLIIVLIGSTSLRAILGLKSKITEVRGTWHNWYGVYVMPIFHPSYLLRNPSKDPGKPFDLTTMDFKAIRNKFNDLSLVPKRPNLLIPFSC